jgi:hypothetical protein
METIIDAKGFNDDSGMASSRVIQTTRTSNAMSHASRSALESDLV